MDEESIPGGVTEVNERQAIIALLFGAIILSVSYAQVFQVTSMREKEGYVECFGVVYEFYQDGSDALYVRFTDEDKRYSFVRDETSEKLLHLSSGDFIRIFYSRNLFDPALRLNEIRKIREVSIA